jgi:hypothetical protein
MSMSPLLANRDCDPIEGDLEQTAQKIPRSIVPRAELRRCVERHQVAETFEQLDRASQEPSALHAA